MVSTQRLHRLAYKKHINVWRGVRAKDEQQPLKDNKKLIPQQFLFTPCYKFSIHFEVLGKFYSKLHPMTNYQTDI